MFYDSINGKRKILANRRKDVEKLEPSTGRDRTGQVERSKLSKTETRCGNGQTLGSKILYANHFRLC